MDRQAAAPWRSASSTSPSYGRGSSMSVIESPARPKASAPRIRSSGVGLVSFFIDEMRGRARASYYARYCRRGYAGWTDRSDRTDGSDFLRRGSGGQEAQQAAVDLAAFGIRQGVEPVQLARRQEARAAARRRPASRRPPGRPRMRSPRTASSIPTTAAFAHPGQGAQRGFDLGRGHLLAADVQDVGAAAEQLEPSFGGEGGEVAGRRSGLRGGACRQAEMAGGVGRRRRPAPGLRRRARMPTPGSGWPTVPKAAGAERRRARKRCRRFRSSRRSCAPAARWPPGSRAADLGQQGAAGADHPPQGEPRAAGAPALPAGSWAMPRTSGGTSGRKVAPLCWRASQQGRRDRSSARAPAGCPARRATSTPLSKP